MKCRFCGHVWNPFIYSMSTYCPRCKQRNMTFWEYLTFDVCADCRYNINFSRYGIDMIN